MAKHPVILGPDGHPVRRQDLAKEESAPTLTGVRQALGDHPEDGLTPRRLAHLLREAEQGDPIRQMELAEAVEEKYLHYQGVLGTRKRAVTRLPITVEAASDDPEDVADADLIRDWLRRDTLRGELMDILDAIGKGISFTEIIWDTSEGQWWPDKLCWRDPRFFGFDRIDLETPRLRGEGGQWEALKPYKYIVHRSQAKSGLPIRAGLIRGVAWVYLFQNFGWKSWIEFGSRFGQPFRLGKYGPDATTDDKDALRRAVRALSGDFGGIIPESMALELIEAQTSGQVNVFDGLIDASDMRVSIATLGQNLTTKVEGGSHAASQTHNEVREDIRDADGDDVAVTLNRDLVRPIIDLNRGSRKRGGYPRLIVAEPDRMDLRELRENLKTFVPMGMKVGMSTVRDAIGIPDPDPDEELLIAPGAPAAGPDIDVKQALNGATDDPAANPAEDSSHSAKGAPAGSDAIEDLWVDETRNWQPLVDPVILQIEELAAQSADADEFLRRLPELAEQLDAKALADSLAKSMFAARLAGEAEQDIGNSSGD